MTDRPGASANQSARVSFTVRRPSPVSSRQSSAGPESNATTPAPSFRIPPPPRQKSGYSTNPSRLKNEQTEEEIDSSDEEDPEAAELVSGFDSMGVQRVKPTPKTNGPLVITALKNRDWRQLARQKQAATGYIPDSARAAVITGPDGSQGGMGTRDSINSGPQLTGLIFKKHSPPPVESDAQEIQEAGPQVDEDTPMTPPKPLTEDELALQALLRGTDETTAKPQVAAIPLAPLTEEEALKRDMEDLPDVATLDDYARVPVEQFGMAILRGMGWKPPASGEEELWLPAERPTLLGLGAKARPTPQGSGSARAQATNWKNAERKYVPLIKKDRNGDVVDDAKGSANGRARSGQASRRNSRSRSPQGRSDSSRRARERDDYRDGAREYRDRDKEYRDRDRQDRDRDRDYRRDRGRESERERDRYGGDGYREREKDDDRRRKDEDGSRRRDRDRDSARDDDRSGSSRRKGGKDYDSRR